MVIPALAIESSEWFCVGASSCDLVYATGGVQEPSVSVVYRRRTCASAKVERCRDKRHTLESSKLRDGMNAGAFRSLAGLARLDALDERKRFSEARNERLDSSGQGREAIVEAGRGPPAATRGRSNLIARASSG